MSASAPPSGSRPTDGAQVVSTLSGFDPSRKKDVFQVQLDMQRRAVALDNGGDAAKALQWLNEYGLRVLTGSTYGNDFTGSEEAKPYLAKAGEEFAKRIHEYATGLALADVEAAYASAIEARSDVTGTGTAEGESAVGEAETPKVRP